MVLATTTPFQLMPMGECRSRIRSAIQRCCLSAQSGTRRHPAMLDRRADERLASRMALRVYPAVYDSVNQTCELECHDADVGQTRDLNTRGVGWQQAVDFECEHVALEIETPSDRQSLWILVEVRWSRRGMFGVESGGTIVGMLRHPE